LQVKSVADHADLEVRYVNIERVGYMSMACWFLHQLEELFYAVMSYADKRPVPFLGTLSTK
jgi:hypothetical protein